MTALNRSFCALGFAETKPGGEVAPHTPPTVKRECAKALNDAEISVLNLFDERLMQAVSRLFADDNGAKAQVEEIRLGIGKPVRVLTNGGETVLNTCGVFKEEDAENLLLRVCENSIYAKEKELRCGFVTLRGGARVGLCGEPVVENGRIAHFQRIYAFNIRIPREVKGCAEKSVELLMENGRPRSSLIVSPPGVGKTTFLRDCARCLSEGGAGRNPLKVAIADERGEITGGMGCVPLLDVGTRTDSMIGVPKTVALPMLVRNMSPNVIVTDELAGEDEMDAVVEAVKCGVAVIASAHAGCGAELIGRRGFAFVLKSGLMRAHMLARTGNRLILSAPLEL